MVLHSRLAAGVVGSIVLMSSAVGMAHISTRGPAFAGTNQILTFGVGHGCEGADTFRVAVQIPEEVTAVRALPSAWGEAVLAKDDAGSVTSVTWAKTDVRPADDQYYQFGIRIAVPDAPFTKLYLPSTQTCRTAEGEERTVEWAARPEEIAAAKEGEEPPAAAWVWVVPERVPGWNKYTVAGSIEDLSVFDDAQIVWAGDAAYSANAETMALIRSEDDVDELAGIAAGAEIWVKY
jgi:periplasmic copper chaperone A